VQTRSIGSLQASVIGLGCNNFGRRLDEDGSRAVVHAALDAGITFFDTADIYGATRSEEILGRALGSRRDDVAVATKFGNAIDDEHRGARPDYVERAVEDSLRRLGTDRIDLYQLHVPDPDTPIADTLGALDEFVRSGKVLQIGCSNFDAKQLAEADEAVAPGAVRFVSVQNEYSLLQREPEMEVLPECERLGLAFIPYFPLMSGLLSGKYRRGEEPPAGTRLATYSAEDVAEHMTERNLDTVDRLSGWATEHGRSILELAIAWLLARPAVATVITGASTPDQVRQNVAAGAWHLTTNEVREVDALAPPASS
jgi:aryl-alcohol dehydrogenase-like predicted oxidoreductase